MSLSAISTSTLTTNMVADIYPIKQIGARHNVRDRWTLEPNWPVFSPQELQLFRQLENLQGAWKGRSLDVSGIWLPLIDTLPAPILYLLANQAYEHGDIALIRKYVTAEDGAVVLGSGLGVIAAAMAQQTGKRVAAWDANPNLQKWVVSTALANELDITFHWGCVTDTPADDCRFFLSEEFWSSSMDPKTRLCHASISVPGFYLYETCQPEHNTMFVDIEGGEMTLFQSKVPNQIKKLFVEIHRPNLGNAQSARVMNQLYKQGFELVDSAGLTYYWSRSGDRG